MRILERTLTYGYGFRDGRKYIFVSKGYRVLQYFTFVSVVRLTEEEAGRIVEFLSEKL